MTTDMTCMRQTVNRIASCGKSTSPAPTLGVWDPNLQISGLETSLWTTYPCLPNDPCSFEVAELRMIWKVSIVGKIEVNTLLKNTSYGTFLVFKLKPNSKGVEKAKALVRFLNDQVEGVDYDALSTPVFIDKKRDHLDDEFGQFPRDRGDGWMEVQLGEFYNEDGDDGIVQMQLVSTTPGFKTGLIVGGIDVRPYK